MFPVFRLNQSVGSVSQYLAGLLFSILLLALNPATAAAPIILTDVALVEALRAGGYNLYFRHVATDWSQSDHVHEAGDWLNCDPSRMRQLSAAGRADAVAIGKAMRSLKIPVGSVLASPYCRTMETARLMEVGSVQASTEVMNLRASDYFGGRSAIIDSARRLLSTPPQAGSNRVIVAHGNVAREATPVYPGEGEGLVFKPEGDGRFTLIGRVKPSDWGRIMKIFDL